MELAKDEFENLLFMMIIQGYLTFSLVELESFKDLFHFLRDDVPTISRATMRRRVEAMYEKEFQTPKEMLDNNTGKLSITIDEWKAGKNVDFPGITLYYHNNKFEFENHTIGFEDSRGKGFLHWQGIVWVFDGSLEKSITRDNAVPMTFMMDKHREWSSSQEVEFDGDRDARAM